MENLLNWCTEDGTYQEARLGTKDDGVLFVLQYQPTCYRRGPFRLNIEVTPNHETHHLCGCFDEADQPTRYYHNSESLYMEAESLAKVLWADRQKASSQR